MFRITEVIKHLMVINVLLFFGTMILMGEPAYLLDQYGNIVNVKSWGRTQLAMFYPLSNFFQPYQIVTHMFMHGDLGHLFFNMIGLFFFGPIIEDMMGSKRFLFYYFFTGFGALLLHLIMKFIELNFMGGSPALINSPVLGASGAVFGVLAAYALKFPNKEIMLLIPPMPLKAKYIILLYAGFTIFAQVGNFAQGIAHFAHLGGALFGGLLLVFWESQGRK